VLIRLTIKLANTLDGIDVSHVRQGDVVELSAPDAELMIAEGWAERVAGNGHRDAATQSDCVMGSELNLRSPGSD
jgi:hypothetical protein